MLGFTNFITEARWTDIMLIWFVLIDDAYQVLEQQYGAWRRRGPAPQFYDSAVITVALLIDTFFHGHEALGLSFVRQYHAELFPNLPSDGHFNERRTQLGPLIDQLRRQITCQAGLLDREDAMRLLDSAPIFVATYGRGGRNQTLTGSEYFGVAKSQGAKVFGLRLTITTTTDQVLDRWMLAPAAYHDSATMADALAGTTDALVLGDGAYHNRPRQPCCRSDKISNCWHLPAKIVVNPGIRLPVAWSIACGATLKPHSAYSPPSLTSSTHERVRCMALSRASAPVCLPTISVF